MYCDKFCNEETPCFLTCCPPNKAFVNGSCQTTLEESENPLLRRFPRLSSVNLEKAGEKAQSCPDGHIVKILKKEEKCLDDFAISINADGEQRTEVPELTSTRIKGGTKRFCSYFTFDQERNETLLQPQICIPDPSMTKFSFYPYILITSAVFLLLTYAVYTIWDKLLNPYTRLMRHFVLNLAAAFIIFGVNQFTLLSDVSMFLCKFSGFAKQYLFLAAFSFMTSMSVQLSYLMSGNKGGRNRLIKMVIVGYGAPAVISFITVIIEMFGRKCDPFRPRFGEEGCFFAGK